MAGYLENKVAFGELIRPTTEPHSADHRRISHSVGRLSFYLLRVQFSAEFGAALNFLVCSTLRGLPTSRAEGESGSPAGH